MKRILVILLCTLFVTLFAFAVFAGEGNDKACCKKDGDAKAMSKKMNCENCYGECIGDVNTVKLTELKSGKELVAVEGTITTVCQAAGCWIMIKDGDKNLFVKAKGESFFMPKNAAGATAKAHGIVKETEMSEEMLKHFAKDGLELGEIKGPRKMLMMVASGVQMTPKEGQKLESVKEYKCDDKDGKTEKAEMKESKKECHQEMKEEKKEGVTK